MIREELNNYYKTLFLLSIFDFAIYQKNISSRLSSRLVMA